MKWRTAVLGCTLLVVAALAGPATAGGLFQARLDGYQEVPAVSSGGAGAMLIWADEQMLRYRLWYAGLEGGIAQAHIHFGQTGVNGGVSVFLCTNLGNGPADTQPCPSSPGRIEGTITAADVLGPENQGLGAGNLQALVQAIKAGATYVNIHTDSFPAGEIRGQIDRGNRRR
jgi:hypothetical protein